MLLVGVAGRVDRQLDDNTQAWLANAALNEFVPEKHVAKVSRIFQWYAGDFNRGGGSVEAFLARYRPQTKADFAAKSFQIEYKTYDWGLNDSSPLGNSYSPIRFLWDYYWNK